MSSVRDLIQANGPAWLASGGFLIGVLFGAIVYRTNFCTMGALSDVMNIGDWRRLRAWLLAAATSLAGAQVLDAAGVVQLSKSMYLTPSLNWAGNILGGLLFGLGMVFAGGCASRNLARAGGGDLRALLTLVVLGIFAYAASGGVFGPPRLAIEQATSIAVKAPTQSLGDLLAAAGLVGPATGPRIVAAVVVAAALLYCFAAPDFRSSPPHVIAGLGIGLCVAAGWALTGLAFDDLADRPLAPISLTFVRPAGDTLEWFQRFTAARMPGFGVATVLGTVAGAFLAAKLMGRFRIATFTDVGDTVRCLAGAALMGIGGVMALGCTVGQAITGVSTLAVGSLLTFVSIVAGGICGLKLLERWLTAEV
jgi:uncharacterized membrane protein YedE/YeeE